MLRLTIGSRECIREEKKKKSLIFVCSRHKLCKFDKPNFSFVQMAIRKFLLFVKVLFREIDEPRPRLDKLEYILYFMYELTILAPNSPRLANVSRFHEPSSYGFEKFSSVAPGPPTLLVQFLLSFFKFSQTSSK